MQNSEPQKRYWQTSAAYTRAWGLDVLFTKTDARCLHLCVWFAAMARQLKKRNDRKLKVQIKFDQDFNHAAFAGLN